MVKLENYLENPRSITSIYNNLQLSEVELIKFQFHQDGPNVKVSLKINELPDNPPKKWGDYNAVVLELDLWDVEKCFVKNWSTETVCKLEIQGDSNKIVELKSSRFSIVFECGGIYLQKIRDLLCD